MCMRWCFIRPAASLHSHRKPTESGSKNGDPTPSTHLLLKRLPPEEVHKENEAANHSRQPRNGAILRMEHANVAAGRAVERASNDCAR